MFAPMRFVWNATRGHRLAPWRSEYLKWRIETFSGKKAESLRGGDVLAFLWTSRWEMLDFLLWTGIFNARRDYLVRQTVLPIRSSTRLKLGAREIRGPSQADPDRYRLGR